MAYRKLTINEKIYQYTIGKANIHIKLPEGGSLNAKREEVGKLITSGDCGCGCGSECPDKVYDYAVTPVDVKEFIERSV